jgi:RimJ/RimL family protein N-acetyltransferase
MSLRDGRCVERLTPYMAKILAMFMEDNRDSRGFTYFLGRNAEDMARDEHLLAWLWTEYGRAIAYGHIELSANPRKSDVCRFGVCVDKDYQGHGLGTAVVELLLAQARLLRIAVEPPGQLTQVQRLRKVVATVYADNAAMLRIYDKVGFEEEGCFRREECWDGSYRDIVSLAKFL